MSKLLIVGASHGIGKALLDSQIDQRVCINISRTPVGINHVNLEEYQLDVLNDELPDLTDVSSIVYCPGSINLKPISSLKEQQLIEDFQINVVGAYRVIKKYHRELKKSSNPSIVCFSTVAVGQGMPFHTSVAAAKGAVEGMVRSLAAEFAPTIRVNAIAPTITDTPLASGLLRNETMIDKMKERHPLKRILNAQEVAAMTSFLIGDHAQSITGQIIGIDAGMSSVRV